ncbi:MAG: DUF488 domain-containing protein [Planctomycetota bacterium]
MKSPIQILTVGHSNHPTEKLIELLRTHGVTAIADVRSAPFSRHSPQFNRETLEAILKREELEYVFLGRELGARSDDRSCYDAAGQVQYGRLASTDLFRSGLQRVLEGAEKHRLALMCAEKEPLECHRTLLVSLELAKQGVSIFHILASGQLESHDETLDRLLQMEKLGGADLFRSRADKLSEACARQEKRIAYATDPNAAPQEMP